tara:strand:- start:126689 stop:129055 length:2367 start_codon:yes stop_codon:yes gene_type:complete
MIRLNYDRMKVAAMRKHALGSFGGGGGSGAYGGSSGFGGSGAYGGGFGTGGRNTINRYNPVYDDLSEGTIIEQFMPVDPRRLHRIWRRIRLQDPVAAPVIDLYSDLPWSDFQVVGVEDREIAQTYADALNAIDITNILPQLSNEYLSMGKVIGHLLMNESKGYWDRLIIHDPDWIRVTPIPMPGFQPKLDIIPTPEMRGWANSSDPRDLAAQRHISELIDMIRDGQSIPLHPDQTFYLPRKVSPYDVTGASIFTRIIMFVAYEKALVNSTIAASRRRASRIRHITAGIDDVWEPSPGELDDLAGLFMQADEDPVGALVVTRSGVQASEVGGGTVSDITKISDEWQFLLQGKLNALGVSEQFITGDANFNAMEQVMSTFLEKIKAHRNYFVNSLIKEKILKPIAERNGFFHQKKANVDHRIRVASDFNEDNRRYILPTLAWEKSLKPVADRDYLEILQMMEEKGIPVTKRTWSSAAGFDLDSEIEQFSDDIETSRQLARQKKKVMELAPEAAGGQGGMGGDLGSGLGELGGGMGGMDMGMGGMDMGMGGMDMGGDMGGGMGGDMGMGGDAGADAGLELPSIGASFKGAATEKTADAATAPNIITSTRRNYRRDREMLDLLDALPVWKGGEFMGISKDQAELYARRLLDSLGEKLAKTLTKAEARRILSTGHNRRDQVLRYIMARIGILKNADVTREVAMDIYKNLQKVCPDPKLLAGELTVVAHLTQVRERRIAGSKPPDMQEVKDIRNQFFRDNPNQARLIANSITQESKHVNNVINGFVDDPAMLKE